MKTKTISKEIREKLLAQALTEIPWARRFKQGKIINWQKNENMYYAKKQANTEARANMELSRMQDFVHTTWSKIDNPLLFKFTKRKESQLKRVQRINSLVEQDRQNDIWDIKDLVGKKQAIIYGRAIFSYYADSVDGEYKPHLEPVDVYDFLIDPAAGGYDIEKARFMGDYGVTLTKQEIQEGIDNGTFIKEVGEALIANPGNNTESSQELTNKMQRMYDQDTMGQKELQSDDKFRFWRWINTYYNPKTKTSDRYYMLMQEIGGRVLRCVKLTELTSPTKDFPKGPFPYWTYAAYMDLTEFWTPSPCDYARELFMGQHVSINQMLDNAEQINKPMRVVSVGMIENLTETKYRRDGQVKVKGNFDVNKAYQIINTPSIDTPLKVFDKLEQIVQMSIGPSPSATQIGDAPSEQKVAIYEGNEAEQAGKTGLFTHSYSFGYSRFAKLYTIGVRDNLIKKVAIQMIGPDGVEQEEYVKLSDVLRPKDDFGMLIEASNAETLESNRKQSTKIAFLQAHSKDQNPIQNPKKAYETEASIAGFSKEEIRELTDMSEFGNATLMSAAAKDIEDILDGKKIKPNPAANKAYMQKILDFAQEHQQDFTDRQKIDFVAYMHALTPIAIDNEARALQMHMNNLNETRAMAQPSPSPAGQDVESAQGTSQENNNTQL